MATIQKRQLKKGIVYDIQVKFKDFNTQNTIVKTTTWCPKEKMTEKQQERECALFAKKFEEEIKKSHLSSIGEIVDYNYHILPKRVVTINNNQ